MGDFLATFQLHSSRFGFSGRTARIGEVGQEGTVNLYKYVQREELGLEPCQTFSKDLCVASLLKGCSLTGTTRTALDGNHLQCEKERPLRRTS